MRKRSEIDRRNPVNTMLRERGGKYKWGKAIGKGKKWFNIEY
jgi:hypothetical protein